MVDRARELESILRIGEEKVDFPIGRVKGGLVLLSARARVRSKQLMDGARWD